MELGKRTYQMQIPVFLASVLITLYVVEEFTKAQALTNITTELSLWGTIIISITFLFGYFFGVLQHLTRVIRNRKQPFNKGQFRGIVTLASFTFTSLLVLAVGLNDQTYQWVYQYIPGYISLIYVGPLMMRYMVQRLIRFDDIYTTLFFATMLFCGIAYIPIVNANVPFIYDIYVWLQNIPNTAASQATVLTVGVGAAILGVRALIGREPGIIEIETV
jgi:hypothetical protein